MYTYAATPHPRQPRPLYKMKKYKRKKLPPIRQLRCPTRGSRRRRRRRRCCCCRRCRGRSCCSYFARRRCCCSHPCGRPAHHMRRRIHACHMRRRIPAADQPIILPHPGAEILKSECPVVFTT